MTLQNVKEFVQWEAASRDTIDLKRVYIDISGDLVAGVFVSQLLFYFLPWKDPVTGVIKRHPRLVQLPDNNWWLPMNDHEWWDACRVKSKQVGNLKADIGISQDRNGDLVQKQDSKGLVVFRNTFHKDKKTPMWRPNWPVFLKLLNDATGAYKVPEADVPPAPENASEDVEEEGKVPSPIEEEGFSSGGQDDFPDSGKSVSPPANEEGISPNQENRSPQNRKIGFAKTGKSVSPFSENLYENTDRLEDGYIDGNIDVFGDKSPNNNIHAPSARVDAAVDVSKTSSKPRQKEKKFTSPFDGLTEAQIEIARLLVENGVWAKPAADLAASPGVTRQGVEHQIEWLPARVAEIEAKGDEVLNPAGLLRDAIFNMAPRPASLEHQAKAEATRRAIESAEAARRAEDARRAEERRQAEAAAEAERLKWAAEFDSRSAEERRALDAVIFGVYPLMVNNPAWKTDKLPGIRASYLKNGWQMAEPEAEESGPRYLELNASMTQLNAAYASLSQELQEQIEARTGEEAVKAEVEAKPGSKVWEMMRHRAMRSMMLSDGLRIEIPVEKSPEKTSGEERVA